MLIGGELATKASPSGVGLCPRWTLHESQLATQDSMRQPTAIGAENTESRTVSSSDC